jgi:hypothetical protein
MTEVCLQPDRPASDGLDLIRYGPRGPFAEDFQRLADTVGALTATMIWRASDWVTQK